MGSKTMKAMLVREFNEQPLELLELPVPEPNQNELIVKVDIAGAEFSGTVVEQGSGVTEFAVGGRVAVTSFLGIA